MVESFQIPYMCIGAPRDFIAQGQGYARLASWSSHFFTSYWV